MSAHGSDDANVGPELARIRGEVDAGNSDLKALGFWKLVGRVKRDPALIEAHADEIGAIDRMAFEARFRIRFPVALGNGVLLLGSLAMVGLFVLAIDLADPLDELVPYADLQSIQTTGGVTAFFGLRADPWAGLLLLAAAGGLSVTLHDLAHWVVGRMGGIRFSTYFLDGPFRIQPGLKTDYATYLRAHPRKRARMHAAGAVASKLAPFLVLAAIFVVEKSRLLLLPDWTRWAILALGVVQILTDIVWSTKRSDWKKYAREKRVAADLYSRRTPGSSDAPG